MTLDEANKLLEAIVERRMDTIYLRAVRDYYGMPIAIHTDGQLSPDDYFEIAAIVKDIDI